MNILILNYEFPPLGGGAGNATYYLLKEFSKRRDISMTLVTSSCSGYREENFSGNIRVVYLDIFKNGDLHHQSAVNLLVYGWRAYRYCLALIKKEKFDLAHAFFSVPCGYVAQKLRLPYLVSLRGSDVPGHNPKHRLAYIALRGTILGVWQKAVGVIANSHDLKREAESVPCAKINIGVIGNGIDTQRFKPKLKEDDKFSIIYTGRLSRVKGLEYLIDGYRVFAQGKTDTDLVLIGGGELENELKTRAEGIRSVKFIGKLDQDQLIAYYQSSDVFVLPSLNEGMSNSLLEAMACGLAVISTDTGGAAELIPSDALIEKKSSAAIANILARLYGDRRLLAEMKKANLEKAGHLSWEEISRQYLALYGKLCAE